MLSTKVVPIPTIFVSTPSVDVTPFPTVVSYTKIGSPIRSGSKPSVFMPVNSIDSFELKVVVVIPVIIPEVDKIDILLPAITSSMTFCLVINTLGGFEEVYPIPPLVIEVSDIVPPAPIVAVAVAVGFAVVPIPVVGIPIDIEVVAPRYPDPPLIMFNDEIVPAADTFALNDAGTGSGFPEINLKEKFGVESSS